jgi:molecular chaperone GrpE
MTALQIVNGEDFPPMKELINLYKTALLDGNDEVLGEVEKAITALEKEKSMAASQFESMTAEISSGKEKFLRLNADLENFRKQTEKYRAKFTSNIQVEVVQSLLPLVDSFEKMNLENNPETEKEQKISTSYQGIYKQLVETLRYLGVGVVETVGKPFDPSVNILHCFYLFVHFVRVVIGCLLKSLNTNHICVIT